MAGEMLQKPTGGRLLTALRLAFYPAFESAGARRFQETWQKRRCFIQWQ